MKVIDLELPPSVSLNYNKGRKYYYSKKEQKEYIMFAPYSQSCSPLYRYDFSIDKWEPFTNYPMGIKVSCALLTVDNVNNCMYIFRGSDPLFAKFDFNSNEWTIIHQEILYNGWCKSS